MVYFLCLHYASELGEELAINADHVISMSPHPNGGTVVYARGSNADGIIVKESMNAILLGKFTVSIEGRQKV